MRPNASSVAEKLLPERIVARLSPFLRRADALLTGHDANASAQRMSLTAFAIRVSSAAIAFLSQVLFARWMGQFEYGIFALVWLTMIIVGNLSGFGFHTTIIRYVPEYIEKKLFGDLQGILHTGRVFAIVSSSVIAVLGAAGIFLFRDTIESYYVAPFYLGLICLPMIALGDMLDGTARSRSWAMMALTPTYIIRPVLTLAAMAVAHFLGFPETARIALISAIFATYATTLFQFLSVRRGLARTLPLAARKRSYRDWFSVSIPIFLVEGAAFLLISADVLLVGFFMSPGDVGVYFATTKILALVHFVYFSVKAGSAHRYSQLIHEGDRSRLNSFVRNSVRWTFWPSIGMAAVILLLGWPLLALFGPEFVVGYPLLFILVVGVIARASVGPSESLLNMSGQQKVCASIYMATLAVNVLLNIFLIPRFGLYGAAIATALSMIFEALTLSIAVHRRLGIAMFVFARQHPENTATGTSR
ncbi:MAG: lipopolysaccharide biosynthesis protein [Phyllobacterium sp.]